MANGKFVAYYRVSTQKQGISRLGLEAQESAVKGYLNGGVWELLKEFTEVETGKGKEALTKRPQLKAALLACKKLGAVLIIAKLDRLARNVHFISGLMETKVKFVACDMPEANELTIHVMAAFAEHEAKIIVKRTKDAIAEKKIRVLAGTDASGITVWNKAWGATAKANLKPNIEARKDVANAFAEKLRSTFEDMEGRGMTRRDMVAHLNSICVPAPKGGAWGLSQAQRLIARLKPAA